MTTRLINEESTISIKLVISLFLPQNGVIDVWLSGLLPNNS